MSPDSDHEKGGDARGLAPPWRQCGGVDLCYVLSHGFAARMVLHSELIPELARRGLSVAVLVPAGEEVALAATARERGFRVAAAEPPRESGPRLSQWFRPYVYEDVRLNPALWSKHLKVVEGGGRRRAALRLFYAYNRVACRLGFVRSSVMALERRGLRSAAVAAVLRELAPRAVVSTYPVNDFEGAALLEARRRGILTVGQLLSWDNITSKGRWLVVPDRFVAWGPIMAEELAAHYGVNGASVVCAGVPHFDAHLTQVSRERIAGLLHGLGLRGDRPYLFFGMSSPVFAPTEIDLVERLAGAVGAGVFGDAMQLLVRPHPQNVQGSMADGSWLPRLEAVRSTLVGVNYPRLVEGSALPWSMEREDLVDLANLVGGCSVCLNSGSTLSIDAIVQDRPVVLPLFDLGPPRPWYASVRRVADYVHQRTMLDLGGVRVTGSLEETEEAIRAYLDNPSRDAEGRRRVRERELGVCDGRATGRVAEALKGFVAPTTAGAACGT